MKRMGDGLLAEFPSAVEAVAAAVEIQVRGNREVQPNGGPPIVLRIGINIGDVLHEKGDIYGDGVNVAARLEAHADPGGILIAANVHDEVRDKLALSYLDRGEIAARNIARPVHAYAIAIDEAAVALAGSPSPDAGTTAPRKRRSALLAVVVATLLAAGASGWLWLRPAGTVAPALAASGPPAIAVLPFEVPPGVQDQAYFAEGLSDDLITDLARLHDVAVIARDSTLAYRDRQASPGEVGRDLGARYVVAGSVRHQASQPRINVRLTDTASEREIRAAL